MKRGSSPDSNHPRRDATAYLLMHRREIYDQLGPHRDDGPCASCFALNGDRTWFDNFPFLEIEKLFVVAKGPICNSNVAVGSTL